MLPAPRKDCCWGVDAEMVMVMVMVMLCVGDSDGHLECTRGSVGDVEMCSDLCGDVSMNW